MLKSRAAYAGRESGASLYVDVEILTAHFDALLPADESDALAEFEQEFLDVGEQIGFQFAFVEGFVESEEVEDVGVSEHLGGKIWSLDHDVKDVRSLLSAINETLSAGAVTSAIDKR